MNVGRTIDSRIFRLRRKFDLEIEQLPLLGLYRRLAMWTEPSRLDPQVCRDADDDWVLATALAGEAEAIVSGDNDLLILRRHRGIAILSPRGPQV